VQFGRVGGVGRVTGAMRTHLRGRKQAATITRQQTAGSDEVFTSVGRQPVRSQAWTCVEREWAGAC
jgi:hypothetical protein